MLNGGWFNTRIYERKKLLENIVGYDALKAAAKRVRSKCVTLPRKPGERSASDATEGTPRSGVA